MAELRQVRTDAESLKKLRALMEQLPQKVGGRRALVGMRRAMRTTLKEAKDDAPTRSGALKKSLHVVRGRRSKPESPYVVLRVNPKKEITYTTAEGHQVTARPTSYFHFVAYGVGPQVLTTKGRGFAFTAYDEDGRPLVVRKVSRKGYAGQDLIGDAWNRTRDRVAAEVADEIRKSLEEFIKKNGAQ